jgi:cytochrome b6-f complex iron-sulfur subunit
MADELANLSPEERRKRRIEEAKRKAAARLGKDVSELKSAPTPKPAQAAATPAAPAKEQPAAVQEVPEPSKPQTATAKTTEAKPQSAADRQAERIAAAKAKAAAKTAGVAKTAPKPAAAKAAPAKPKAAPAAKAAPKAEVGQPGINRREFLTYAWAAALGLVALEGGAATFFFMYPRFRAGEFGGKFELGPASKLPAIDQPPVGRSDGKFWLVTTEEGPKALYMVCTHLGCLYKWQPARTRFECPCHGSKFTKEGDYIEGPAPRSLDQFIIEVVQNGSVVATTTDSGDAIVPPQVPGPDAEIVVNTGKRLLGKPSSTSPARAVAG